MCSSDLLSSTSDDWVLRFKTTASQISSSVQAGNGFFIGLSDSDQSTSQNSNQDFVGMSYYYDNTSTHRTMDSDGASLPHLYQGDSSQNFSVSQGNDYWFEIIKNGSDYTVEAFTSSDYSTGSQGQISGTTTATGLQYVKIMNEMSNGNVPTSTNPFIVTVDDMKFFDGITSVVDTTGLGTSSPSTTNLIAHWDFEQTGDTLENQATVTNYADLIGQSIDNVKLRVEKVGSPTGTAEVGVWDSNNNKVHSFGNYDMSTATSVTATIDYETDFSKIGRARSEDSSDVLESRGRQLANNR